MVGKNIQYSFSRQAETLIRCFIIPTRMKCISSEIRYIALHKCNPSFSRKVDLQLHKNNKKMAKAFIFITSLFCKIVTIIQPFKKMIIKSGELENNLYEMCAYINKCYFLLIKYFSDLKMSCSIIDVIC